MRRSRHRLGGELPPSIATPPEFITPSIATPVAILLPAAPPPVDPLASSTNSYGSGGFFHSWLPFILGGTVGMLLAVLAVASLVPLDYAEEIVPELVYVPAGPSSLPVLDPSAYPPTPDIRSQVAPGETPTGVPEDPNRTLGILADPLPGVPGEFELQNVSFSYPPSWGAQRDALYLGLRGDNLWTAPIGVSTVDRVVVRADVLHDASAEDPAIHALQVADDIAVEQDGYVLRPPQPIEAAGVTMYWSDVLGREYSGVDVLTRIYLFAWNDTRYLFGCQEALRGGVGIIRMCDDIISTLRLGLP